MANRSGVLRNFRLSRNSVNFVRAIKNDLSSVVVIACIVSAIAIQFIMQYHHLQSYGKFIEIIQEISKIEKTIQIKSGHVCNACPLSKYFKNQKLHAHAFQFGFHAQLIIDVAQQIFCLTVSRIKLICFFHIRQCFFVKRIDLSFFKLLVLQTLQ